MIFLKTEDEIELLRQSNQLVGRTLAEVAKVVKPGVTTRELDKVAEEFIRDHGATPTFKGFPNQYGEPFPASICTSVNEQVVHGIPDKKNILKDGDIISLDTGVIYKGYQSDAARTHAVGEISPEDQKLIDVTKQSFFEGMKMAKAGNHLYDISKAIQNYAESNGFSVVREMVGHGIGKEMHEEPQIPNFKPIGRGMKLRAGMTFAVEPMINRGKKEIWILDDGWTCVTRDGMNSAHYENTLLITEGEPELLSYNKDLV